MKKKTLILPLLITPLLLLSSCDNLEWAWWTNDNITIVKGMSYQDAESVVASASMNTDHNKSATTSYSYETFYLDYLGAFASEVDSNTVISSQTIAKRYNNDVTHSEVTYTSEVNYLTAYSVTSYTQSTYLVYLEGSGVTQTVVTDYGYTTPSITTTSYPLYDVSALYIGYSLGTLSSTNASYGFASNNQVVIEQFSTTSGVYTVRFNNTSLHMSINNYSLFRFDTFTNDDGEEAYALDYYVQRVRYYLSYDIFEEPLTEPFLVMEATMITSYSDLDNGDFDTSSIPTEESLS